jgi:hypothetical protein
MCPPFITDLITRALFPSARVRITGSRHIVIYEGRDALMKRDDINRSRRRERRRSGDPVADLLSQWLDQLTNPRPPTPWCAPDDPAKGRSPEPPDRYF